MPWHCAYDQPRRNAPNKLSCLAEPSKALVIEKLSFGCWTAAFLFSFNMNTVPLTLQLMGWQVKRHPLRRSHEWLEANRFCWGTIPYQVYRFAFSFVIG
jgi:hypothetical protein